MTAPTQISAFLSSHHHRPHSIESVVTSLMVPLRLSSGGTVTSPKLAILRNILYLMITCWLLLSLGTVSAKKGATGVKHVVMFSIRDGVSERRTRKAIQQALLQLPQEIEEIEDFELGTDLKLPAGQKHPAGKNRLIAWTVTFDSVKDYNTYNEHPAHKAFLKDILQPVVQPGSRAAIQYKFEKK